VVLSRTNASEDPPLCGTRWRLDFDGSAPIGEYFRSSPDITGAVVVGVKAELWSHNEEGREGELGITKTDALGKFTFSNLPGGNYVLRLTSPGFQSLTVKSIYVADGADSILPALETVSRRNGLVRRACRPRIPATIDAGRQGQSGGNRSRRSRSSRGE